MIIWSGNGFLIFIIVFVDALLAELISESVTSDDRFYQTNFIPLGCSFLISALIIKILSNYFAKKKVANKGSYEFDKITIANSNHKLFFIPFNYWPYILAFIGVATILYQVLKKS